MTQVEFWRLLAKAGRKNKWTVGPNGNIHDGDIRCARGECPILAVYSLVFPEGPWVGANGSYLEAASDLGLSEGFATNIMLAADGPIDEDETNGRARLFPIRKKMIKTLRIKVAF